MNGRLHLTDVNQNSPASLQCKEEIKKFTEEMTKKEKELVLPWIGKNWQAVKIDGMGVHNVRCTAHLY